MIKKLDKNKTRQKRHLRIRKNVVGTSEKPRLNIYRSLNNISAQIVDDKNGETLVSASTMDKAIKDQIKHGGNKEAAKIVGKLIAEKAIDKGIKKVVFDRGGYLYHGRIKSLAEAAREAGLEF